jgi:hypothetical protein
MEKHRIANDCLDLHILLDLLHVHSGTASAHPRSVSESIDLLKRSTLSLLGIVARTVIEDTSLGKLSFSPAEREVWRHCPMNWQVKKQQKQE